MGTPKWNWIQIEIHTQFNDHDAIDNKLFRTLVIDIFSKFEINLNNFTAYKKNIINEKGVFQNQVKNIFLKILHEK